MARKVLILTEGLSSPNTAKSACSVIRYRRDELVGVLDTTVPPQPAQALLEVGGDLLKAVFEDPSAPEHERFKGMGCEGAMINSATGQIANEGEAVDDEEIQRWWAEQEFRSGVYRT